MLKTQVIHRINNIIHRYKLTYPQENRKRSDVIRHIAVDKSIIITIRKLLRHKTALTELIGNLRKILKKYLKYFNLNIRIK